MAKLLRIKKSKEQIVASLDKRRNSGKPIEIRDLREKFFMVDDAYLNGWAKALGPRVSMVYFTLCRHASKDQASNLKIATIADKVGCSGRHVSRALKALEFHGLIKVDRKFGEPNIFWLTDKKHWYRVQMVKERVAPYVHK